MQLTLVFSLLFALLVAIFAIWNSTEIVVKFPFIGQYSTSLALVILGSATLGAVAVMLLGVFNQVKSSLLIWDYKKKINKLEKTIKDLDAEKKELLNHQKFLEKEILALKQEFPGKSQNPEEKREETSSSEKNGKQGEKTNQ